MDANDILNNTDPFQSTLPVKGATPQTIHIPHNDIISIHTPSEGSDNFCSTMEMQAIYFNPHS